MESADVQGSLTLSRVGSMQQLERILRELNATGGISAQLLVE
jgi:hypothetical protein